MSTTFESLRRASPANNSFWAAAAVVLVVVLALGAALIHIQTPPEEPQFVVWPIFEPEITSAHQKTVTPAETISTVKSPAGSVGETGISIVPASMPPRRPR